METVKQPSIPRVFVGENVLITGGTGFVGKVLLEKLIRCCHGVDRIYLIVRPKRGVCIEKRIETLLKNEIFDRCWTERGDIQWCCGSSAKDIPSKDERKGPVVVGVAGDLSEVGLGISDEDRSALESHVSVVFHSAATVKFNEPLRQATFLNTRGTREILELATKMSNLKAFVHVSTAYAHASNNDTVMKECFYPVPMEPEELIKASEEFDDEEFQKVSDRLDKIFVNTYLCTKSMAERIIEKHYGHLPISIYRPGIVGGIHNEPIPGYVESSQGPSMVVFGCASGLIGTVFCNPEVRLEYLPVDHVVNAMLSVAWETIVDRSTLDEVDDANRVVRIYNHVTNIRNPLRTEKFRRRTNEVFAHSKSKGSNYSEMKFTTSNSVHEIHSYLRLSCARMIDAVERTRGKKSNIANMVQKFNTGVGHLLFFMTNEFVYSDARLVALRARCSVANAENGNDPNASCFDFDVSNFDWDQYLRNMLQYLKKSMFGENKKTAEYLLKAGQMFRLFEKSILVTGTALSCASLYLLSGPARWLFSNYSQTQGLHT